MKLEQQVCTLEQAKALEEFGIKAEHYFMYVSFGTQSGQDFALCREGTRWEQQSGRNWIVVGDLSDDLLDEADDDALSADGPIYPAYTPSELGEMLPCESGVIAWAVHYNDHLGVWNCEIRDLAKWKGSGPTPPLIYESEGETMAEAMADTLIHCIEKKLVTI